MGNRQTDKRKREEITYYERDFQESIHAGGHPARQVWDTSADHDPDLLRLRDDWTAGVVGEEAVAKIVVQVEECARKASI